HSMLTVFDDERARETIHKLQTIQREPAQMSVDMGSNRPYNESLRLLKESISTKQVVRFEYINGKNERSSRVVEPVSLQYRYGAWYLFGYCRSRQDYREFKISRVSELEQSQERYYRTHDAVPEPTSFEKYRWSDYMDVELLFTGESLAKAVD